MKSKLIFVILALTVPLNTWSSVDNEVESCVDNHSYTHSKENTRLIVTTDLGGSDPDDVQ